MFEKISENERISGIFDKLKNNPCLPLDFKRTNFREVQVASQIVLRRHQPLIGDYLKLSRSHYFSD